MLETYRAFKLLWRSSSVLDALALVEERSIATARLQRCRHRI